MANPNPFVPGDFPIQEDRPRLDAFNQALQAFGANKNRLLPLITQYIQTTTNFNQGLRASVQQISDKIGRVNQLIARLSDTNRQLLERIRQLQQQLENAIDPAQMQALRDQLALMTGAKTRLLDLLTTVQQELVNFNQTVTAAPYDTLTDASIAQLNADLQAITDSLTQANATLDQILAAAPPGMGGPAAPAVVGGKRRKHKTKKHHKKSKKHYKKTKAHRVKKMHKMHGGYIYGKSKGNSSKGRSSRSRSSKSSFNLSSQNSLNSASKHILF